MAMVVPLIFLKKNHEYWNLDKIWYNVDGIRRI